MELQFLGLQKGLSTFKKPVIRSVMQDWIL